MAATHPIHISILDDHRLFRQGITYILQSLSFDTQVQEAATFAELQSQFAQSAYSHKQLIAMLETYHKEVMKSLAEYDEKRSGKSSSM